MSQYSPKNHPVIPAAKIGILLLNLGTPDATSYGAMRRYLSEFLSDQRVVEMSPWLWQPILQGIILSLRPQKSGRNYEKIWNREQNESPLLTVTRCQSQALSERFTNNEQIMVEFAMRYGNPSTASVMEHMVTAGCQKILLMPLYPQYCAATTASANDQAFRSAMSLRFQPTLRTLPSYHDHPLYIEALAQSLQISFKKAGKEPELVLASFHGMPKDTLDKGDPYYCQCAKTTRLLRNTLGWPEERLKMVFQSRFGPKEWLQPYAEPTTEALAKQGVKSLAVICPGFSTDCIETLEEINMGLRRTFMESGGENFIYVSCLNDQAQHIDLLESLARQELQGWIDA